MFSALPLFVLHRMDWSLLRPLVTFDNAEEVADLKAAGVYVAGFLDAKIRSREDLFDILIDSTPPYSSNTLEKLKLLSHRSLNSPFREIPSPFL